MGDTDDVNGRAQWNIALDVLNSFYSLDSLRGVHCSHRPAGDYSLNR